MDKRKKFAVIFDMDGVLIDSTYYIWESFRQLLVPYGIEISDEQIKKYLGHSLRDLIKIWEEDFKVKLPPHEQFSKESLEIQIKMMKGIPTKSDLIHFLEDLKSHNVSMAVGTSSLSYRANKILKLLGVEGYIGAIITADDVAEHKPNPHVYLEAARRIEVDPQNCVVIEDAASGIEAARRANMKSIGYLTKYNSAESLKGADLLIKSFDEISVEKLKHLFEAAEKS